MTCNDTRFRTSISTHRHTHVEEEEEEEDETRIRHKKPMNIFIPSVGGVGSKDGGGGGGLDRPGPFTV